VSIPEDSLHLEETISDELLRIHRESYGRGAGRARTYILENDVVCFMDDLELLPNEQFLIENGEIDIVLNTRTKFQQAIEPSFVSAVERATGRRVIKFLSNTGLDPNFVIEVFRLAPH
jgi:uncharacterized protein YbcI